MPVAVGIEDSHVSFPKPYLRVPLGVLLDEPDAVIRNGGKKGDVVLFGHGMVYRDIVFVLHSFHGHAVSVVRRFRFECGQCDAAAAYHRFAGAGYDIAAKRADIQLAA